MTPATGTSVHLQAKREKLFYWRHGLVGTYLGFFAWAALTYYPFMDALSGMFIWMASPILAGPFVAYLLCALVHGAVNSQRRHYHSVILSIAVMFGVYGVLTIGWRHQLAIYKPLYASRLPLAGNEPCFAAWRWQDTFGPLQSYFYTLVYDESGEITRPFETRSVDWQTRAAKASAALKRPWRYVFDPAQQTRVTVENKGGHFYMVVEHDG